MEAGAAEVPEEFERSRSRLFGLAYRILGSAEEAEDVVQDTFLRWHRTEAGTIASAPAWLAKVATNLCLNRLTSARVLRRSHIGPWLPEPVPTAGGALGPLDTAEQRDSVSMAFLVLLEQLNPGRPVPRGCRFTHQEPDGPLGCDSRAANAILAGSATMRRQLIRPFLVSTTRTPIRSVPARATWSYHRRHKTCARV
ncbi:sigma factor [Streptomyces zaomyceticus]|uniref:sigma factor n=1 Tax=Streptomyces zaomyceticus TaxID=68286 RepID=UPI00365532AF